MSRQEPEILFTTDGVDDHHFMSSDLHITKGVHNQTLEFNLETQCQGDVYFTMYRHGIEELHKFLTDWLTQNPAQ